MVSKIPYYQLGVKDTLENLATRAEGLTHQEVQERVKLYGTNTIEILYRQSGLIKFLKQFKDALIILLIVSTGISLYLQDYRGASILGALVLINTTIGYIQEAKAERIMQSLKKMLHPTAKVRRNNKIIEVQASELVPGDIVFIQEGDGVPADLRIIEEMNLQANDFSLTGESNPINKYIHVIAGEVSLSGRNNMLFMGTTIATGTGYGIVIATGMQTELGRIASLSHEAVPEPTPLQHELTRVARTLTIGTLILFSLLLLVAFFSDFTLKESFLFAVGIAAAMIPQGLPAQVSLALTSASSRLAKNKALVKQLASVETLGCVNIICTDKTGTLTKNEMTVKHIYVGDKLYDVSGGGYEANGTIAWGNKIDPSVWKHFFHGCFLNGHASANPPDEEHATWYALGDPTEAALVVLAQKAGYSLDAMDTLYPELYEFGFDSNRKMMSSIRMVDGQPIAYVKGAPNHILDHCTHIFDGKQIKKLSSIEKQRIQEKVDELSTHAMRNLAVAYKPLQTQEKQKMADIEQELIFLGFASIIDPPREEVPMAMEDAYLAHIKVIMITGDSALTATAIANKIGLEKLNVPPLTITGEELKTRSDIQLLNDLHHDWIIFCRTSPEDKLRIVTLLKKNNNIVAVTGDGINDAPALKKANIGVAMGKIGTEVAKEAAEIVLLDDSFSTLVKAIKEGRIIYRNLQKTIVSCITSNGGELFAVMLSLVFAGLFGLPIAIIPVQILAIDLIGEMGPLSFLTFDPAPEGLMKEPPRDTKKHLLNKSTIIDLLWSGALMGILGFGMYLLYLFFHGISWGSVQTGTLAYMSANTITYTSILFAQFGNILSRRAGRTQSMFTSYFWSNKRLLLVFGIALCLVLSLVYIPFISSYFSFGPLALIDWLFPLSSFIIFIFVREGWKYILRKKEIQ